MENEGSLLTGQGVADSNGEGRSSSPPAPRPTKATPTNISVDGRGETVRVVEVGGSHEGVSKADLKTRIDTLIKSKAYMDGSHSDHKAVFNEVTALYRSLYEEEDFNEQNMAEGDKALLRELRRPGERDERPWTDKEIAELQEETPSVTPEDLKIDAEIRKANKELLQMHGQSQERVAAVVSHAREGLMRIGITKKEFDLIEESGLGNDATFLTAAAIINSKLREKGLSRKRLNNPESPKKKGYPKTKKEILAAARKLLGEADESEE